MAFWKVKIHHIVKSQFIYLTPKFNIFQNLFNFYFLFIVSYLAKSIFVVIWRQNWLIGGVKEYFWFVPQCETVEYKSKLFSIILYVSNWSNWSSNRKSNLYFSPCISVYNKNIIGLFISPWCYVINYDSFKNINKK